MRFWLTLGFVRETEQLLPLARAAEELGFHGVALADHLAMPSEFESRYPYAPNGAPFWPIDTPWPDTWVTLTAIGAVTTRLRLASNIYLAALRDPHTAARSIATAAVLTGDRIVCGVAPGWLKEEYDRVGIDFRTRGERLEEMVAALRALWSGEPTAFAGRHVSFAPVILRPSPKRPVPICFGGASDAALRRAATLGDGWMGLTFTREQLRPVLARLHKLRAEAGRADAPFEIFVGLGERPTPEAVTDLESMQVTGVIVQPWAGSRKDVTSVDAKRAALEQFAERVIRVSAAVEGSKELHHEKSLSARRPCRHRRSTQLLDSPCIPVGPRALP
jgi:probable F420-dependent oxidoreductase